MDPGIALAGLLVGFVVGLTGMGGGALMTPVLVLFFNIAPFTAVSSDLVAAAVMKPVGSWVHMRRGTIHWGLVRALVLGSVPSAFVGVLVLRLLGNGRDVQHVVQVALGVALLLAAGSLVLKAYLAMVASAKHEGSSLGSQFEPGPTPDGPPTDGPVIVRRWPTVAVGALGGLVVGMTSVGSGSLIIIALLALYPMLRANTLVGTDLVQAVPLVASAALGHVIFGEFELSLTSSLLVGSVPGVWVGAQLSSRAPGGLVRRALALVLLASALKLLSVPTPVVGASLLGVVILGPLLWGWARGRQGLARRSLTMDVVRRAWRDSAERS